MGRISDQAEPEGQEQKQQQQQLVIEHPGNQDMMVAPAKILGLCVLLLTSAASVGAASSPVDPGPGNSGLGLSPSPRASMVTEELRHGPAFSVLVSFSRTTAIGCMPCGLEIDQEISPSSFHCVCRTASYRQGSLSRQRAEVEARHHPCYLGHPASNLNL